MIYPKIEQCIKNVGGKYTLAIIAAKRAKELSFKMASEFQNSKTKELTYALEEIADGKIVPHFAGK